MGSRGIIKDKSQYDIVEEEKERSESIPFLHLF
jgi:hypothetical protein